MKINKIQFYTNRPINNNYKHNTKTTEAYVSDPIKFAYQDYNINFKGRTPENFYEQEFNIKFMPKTMKEYLNADYETRKHMPPEQIMNECFKYIKIADSVEDAKTIYPNEPLFKNLHEATLKGRSGILSDIKIAQEISDSPMFTDGSNNFGIYLLKKIFLEGKTIKEINKDFFEKDLSPEYKGIITQPITHSTTSSYGIRYPKTDFWNSFIATRDEYKKFFVELNQGVNQGVNKEGNKSKLQAGKSSIKGVTDNKPAPRKFTIKKFQKEQIKQEIKKSKGDKKLIADSIRKRFSKDDPEAAFIVKYLSPIMTVAADKIHLSEEEKYFIETKKAKGEKIENLFLQFWKANPHLLEQYSTAITDTIELFEENYASGGLIPINNEFQRITEDIENKKAIDYVPQEFLELLDYVQTIVPKRLQANEDYKAKQEKWDEHFLWRYGEVKDEITKPEPTLSREELLEKTAEEHNAKVYNLKGINDDYVIVAANLDETLKDYFNKEFFGFPSKFVNLLINRALKSPLMTENAKLSFSCVQIEEKLDDESLLNEKERTKILQSIKSGLDTEMTAASMAIMDVFGLKSGSPVKIYRNTHHTQRSEDVTEYNTLLRLYGNNPEVKSELNRLYDIYKKPLSPSELTKVYLAVTDFIRDFNVQSAYSQESVLYEKYGLAHNIEQIQSMLKDKSRSTKIKDLIKTSLSFIYYSKTLLQHQYAKVQYQAKLEVIASAVINHLIQASTKH